MQYGMKPQLLGSAHSSRRATAVATIQMADTRWPLLLKSLSVTKPDTTIPMMPKISKQATAHPACFGVKAWAPCVMNLGPQSKMAKRTT